MPKQNAKINTEDLNVEEVTEEQEANTQDIIEIPWEDTEHLFNMRQTLNEMQDYFANMCLNFEKNKTSLMDKIIQAESHLYQAAAELKREKNIDDSSTYELKLCSNPNEKSYFLKIEE
tara:strand:+ start:904 stop:1257 length:354 start_codon:yes stop_codon:yes gene_type:complete